MDQGACQLCCLEHPRAEGLYLPVPLVLQAYVLEDLVRPLSSMLSVHSEKLARVPDLIDCEEIRVKGVVLRHVSYLGSDYLALCPDVVTEDGPLTRSSRYEAE